MNFALVKTLRIQLIGEYKFKIMSKIIGHLHKIIFLYYKTINCLGDLTYKLP